MEMYFDMDLSLSEIGEELHISRQGAYDMLKRLPIRWKATNSAFICWPLRCGPG